MGTLGRMAVPLLAVFSLFGWGSAVRAVDGELIERGSGRRVATYRLIEKGFGEVSGEPGGRIGTYREVENGFWEVVRWTGGRIATVRQVDRGFGEIQSWGGGRGRIATYREGGGLGMIQRWGGDSAQLYTYTAGSYGAAAAAALLLLPESDLSPTERGKRRIEWDRVIRVIDGIQDQLRRAKAIRDKKTLEEAETRLDEIGKDLAELPNLRNQVVEIRDALKGQRAELFTLLNQLRTDLDAAIDRLETRLDLLDKQIDVNEWWLTRLERRRFSRARLMLATGREVAGDIKIPPEPQIEYVVPSGDRAGDVITFQPGEILSITTEIDAWQWVDQEKKFQPLRARKLSRVLLILAQGGEIEGEMFIPPSGCDIECYLPSGKVREFKPGEVRAVTTARAAWEWVAGKKDFVLVERKPDNVRGNDRRSIKDDLEAILDKMKEGERQDLMHYIWQRGLPAWRDMHEENRLDLVIEKIAQDHSADIRAMMVRRKDGNRDAREVVALREKIRELAEKARKMDKDPLAQK